ncbi:GNAT family N-acetyltransferase [Streptomyces radicis]|uniref:GNAT family N-acetyltransferase n=2 Tax=Streptomyces radicis TaxID=1750517 RepID=A0A3A9WHA0_9ACTN|nr:GNAT family N-acetyltransferase [Streptomyces radicis]RKN15136.1 GNAT family N-acetyltransferase [Streptomyces radicis]
MGAADIDGVARTRIEGWRHAYRGLMPQEFLDGMRPELFAARLRAGLPRAAADLLHLVAVERDAGVVGWSHSGPYRPDGTADEAEGTDAQGASGSSWGELHALYLRPPFIGHGIGRALMAASTRWLAERGHRGMRLWVLRDNAIGRRFYDRAGLVPDGAERSELVGGTPVHEVRYARGLDAIGAASA